MYIYIDVNTCVSFSAGTGEMSKLGDLCELWGALSRALLIVQGNLRSVEALPRAPQIAGKLSLQLMSSTFKWPRLLRAR